MESEKQYGKAEYWDQRYDKTPDQFDWYQKFSGIRDIVTQFVKPNDVILQIGCGNSRLCEEMIQEGYEGIVNIDISSVVIQQMTEKYG